MAFPLLSSACRLLAERRGHHGRFGSRRLRTMLMNLEA
jgi:hypothetical protein